ncbi:alpha/beta fold hydrolase [Pseudonocardiaceae bacterium YIM PH 21723]|nr:alpha/beta fold hydrolase [Pseudonocardiaceae bacterium YIM PH 21723]
MSEHVVSTATAKVHYTRQGSGPGLLLVHGTSATGEDNFGHLLPELTGGHTVLLPDYAGSGRTLDDGGPLTIEQLSDQMIAVIEDAAVGPVDLLGFSLGATVAATVAARRPDLVRRLILLAGFAAVRHPKDVLAFQTWRALADIDPQLYLRYSLSVAFSPAYLERAGSENLEHEIAAALPVTDGTKRQIDLDLTVDITALLPKITAPTLVVAGTHDTLVSPWNSRELHGGIAGSEYTEIDSGHVVPVEQPAELVAVMKRFFA